MDRRADVYSAAVVMWEALTGKRLFKADDVPALVYAIINDEVEPPSAIVPDLPAGLDAVIMKGIDREAGKRWASARETASMGRMRTAVSASGREGRMPARPRGPLPRRRRMRTVST